MERYACMLRSDLVSPALFLCQHGLSKHFILLASAYLFCDAPLGFTLGQRHYRVLEFLRDITRFVVHQLLFWQRHFINSSACTEVVLSPPCTTAPMVNLSVCGWAVIPWTARRRSLETRCPLLGNVGGFR